MGFFDKIKNVLIRKEQDLNGLFKSSAKKALHNALEEIDTFSSQIDGMEINSNILNLAKTDRPEGKIASKCMTDIMDIQMEAKRKVDETEQNLKNTPTTIKTFKDCCKLAVDYCEMITEETEKSVRETLDKALKDIQKEQTIQKATAPREGMINENFDKGEVSRMVMAGKSMDEIAEEAEKKRKQFFDTQKGMQNMTQNIVVGVTQFGHAKDAHAVAGNTAKVANQMENVSKSEVYNEYLKTIPLSVLAEVNKKVRNVNTSFKHIATGEELLKLVADANMVSRELDDKLLLKQAEANRIARTVKKLQDVYSKGDLGNAALSKYFIVDMSNLGVKNERLEKDLIVLYDAHGLAAKKNEEIAALKKQASEDRAFLEKAGKTEADSPEAFAKIKKAEEMEFEPVAVAINKKTGQIFDYESLEACDKAFGTGLTDPEARKILDIHADIQNHTGTVFKEGVLDIYDGYKYGHIAYVPENTNMDAKISTLAYMGAFIRMGEEIMHNAKMDYSKSIEYTENAKCSNYIITAANNAVNIHEREARYSPFKQDFDYVKDTESEVMKKLNPVIEDIKAGLEAADYGKTEDEMSFLTANGLLDTTRVEMNDGKVGDFAHVTVLSASDNFGHTVSMVFDNYSGEMTSAYYSNSMVVANDVVLGTCIATKEYVDYSIIANVPEVRAFMEKYPVIQQMVRDCGDNTKDFERKGLMTMEDMKYHVENTERM